MIGVLQTIDQHGDSRGRVWWADPDHLDAVLSAAISLIAYRRSYRTEPEPGAVRQLLVHDASNPRSLRFQIEALASRPRPPGDRLASPGAAAVGPQAEELLGVLEEPIALRGGLAELSRLIELEYVAQVPANRLRTGTRS